MEKRRKGERKIQKSHEAIAKRKREGEIVDLLFAKGKKRVRAALKKSDRWSPVPVWENLIRVNISDKKKKRERRQSQN